MSAPVVNDRVLDRLPNWDDRNHLLRVVEPETVAKTPPSAKSHARQIWLDQGQEGGCVGYSGTQALSLSPNINNKLTAANAEWLYWLAKENDEFDGDNYSGSSVLGAQRGLNSNGYTTSYQWCTTVEEIIQALAFKGPVQIGINWYQSMFQVGAGGVITISPGSAIAGGHALCVGGYKLGGEYLRLDNSWGKGWGVNGSAWLAASDLMRLLTEEGEAATFVKKHPMPTLPTHTRVDPGT